MTFRTSARATRFAHPFLGLVAADAVFVHHLFFYQLTLFFKALNTAPFLGKEGMANLAVAQHTLVTMVGKGDNTARSPFQRNLLCAVVCHGCSDSSHKQNHDDPGDNPCKH